MKMNKKKLKSSLFLLLFLVVWGIAAVLLYMTVEHDKNNPVFSVELGESGEEKKLVSVTLENSKSWVNDAGLETETIGAQYDGIVNNLSTEDLTDWRLEITLSGEGKLDSSWNGFFTQRGNVLYYTPDMNVEKILAKSNNSFGFVMISKELLTMESCVLNGYRDVTYEQYPMYRILIVTLILWFVALLSHIVVEIRTRKFEARREQDAKIISETMKTFAEMIDAKDPYTSGHSVRVSLYAKELGRRMKLSEDKLTDLGYIALMHDCGKMGVPDAVLTKPARLDPEERKQMEAHSVIGGKMLEDFSAIEGIQEGAKYHHERYDGKGYPEGLKGEEIPLYARIICVADSYDAMTTDRCYRPRLSREKVLSELKENSGTQFDPKVVPHMIAMMEEGFYPGEKAEQ
ncbi:MAG: HD domain-containing protein [Lachnospiraceae bacterium]|nr:HD domain-containing protein [Lachnospiraceae bacterium]